MTRHLHFEKESLRRILGSIHETNDLIYVDSIKTEWVTKLPIWILKAQGEREIFFGRCSMFLRN